MRRRFWLGSITAVATAALTGNCVLLSGDISNASAVTAGGWHLGAVYQVASPLYLVDLGGGTRALAPTDTTHLHPSTGHQCGPWSLPRTLERYRSAPADWRGVVGVIEPGAELVFERAFDHGFPARFFVWQAPTLESVSLFGRFRHSLVTEELSLRCLALPDSGTRTWRRNPRWLAAASD